MRWSDRRILVTGASGGIGGALVAELAEAGATLLIVGRNQPSLDRLAALAPDRIYILKADLAQAEDRRRVVDAASEARIDMLINAAGSNQFGLFEEQAPAAISAMVELNVTATLLLTQALLPRLLHHDRAWIVNVGSAFGAIGHPGYATYCATKFALRGFSQALRRELADTPVAVLHIAPRATRTGMNSAAADSLNAALGNAVDAPEAVAARSSRASRSAPASVSWAGPNACWSISTVCCPGWSTARSRSDCRSSSATRVASRRHLPDREVIMTRCVHPHRRSRWHSFALPGLAPAALALLLGLSGSATCSPPPWPRRGGTAAAAPRWPLACTNCRAAGPTSATNCRNRAARTPSTSSISAPPWSPRIRKAPNCIPGPVSSAPPKPAPAAASVRSPKSRKRASSSRRPWPSTPRC
ncbi:SDR family oxidoreductase [Salinicola tamaricis]|uniref:SDR family oxidoreductase n=1 Tax=Salinicola tamaricis TaxID=1771309 RepID=UPI001F5E1511|nr:SDR family oxidoreductase [Salinicola tamaricis]